MIHSGCTQEYYSNRIDLDDHAEDLLSFEFGVRSLLRICIEFFVENSHFFYDSLKNELPSNLYNMLCKRIEENNGHTYHYNTPPPPTSQPLLNRSLLHSGI